MQNRNKCSRRGAEDLLLQHEVEVIEGILESKTKYRKVVQAAIAKWVKDFQSGHI